MQGENVEKVTAQPAEHLEELGVAAAASAIRNGDVSSEAYAAALLRRAQKEAGLNSFITIDETAVLTAARAADKARGAGLTAPLLGVPLGIKDSYLTKGLRTTLGIEGLLDHLPSKDADVVTAIKDAGGIVFGKNNLVEMSYGLTGNNSRFGQVKNPYDRSRVTGGSSSGAGGSVAARIVPAALGGDTVGSIRVPASLCGVVGFKPTLGRWSGNGTAPIAHSLDTTGVLARSVEDCALVDRVVTKRSDQAVISPPGLQALTFAYAPKQHLALVDPEVEVRFNEVLRNLRDAGARIVEIDLGGDFFTLSEMATWRLFFAETMNGVSGFLREHGVPASFEDVFNGLKPALKEVWGHAVLPDGAGAITFEQYQAAVSVHRPELQRRFAEAFKVTGAAALLLPTTPCTAPLIAQQDNFSIAGQDVTYMALAKNTVPASGADLPGISIPIGLSSRGMPIGLELDGPHGSDVRLLALAQRVEAAVGRIAAPV
jgi:mandelamide amidase